MPVIILMYISWMINYFYILIFLFTLLTQPSFSQEREGQVAAAVDAFFEAFHAKDTALLKKMIAPGAILQTLKPTIDGGVTVQKTEISVFLKGLASIPDSLNFREELLAIEVRKDGALAHAWTPYRFFMNGALQHCGANSFQWIWQEGAWKLIYLVDTRRKAPCR